MSLNNNKYDKMIKILINNNNNNNTNAHSTTNNDKRCDAMELH